MFILCNQNEVLVTWSETESGWIETTPLFLSLILCPLEAQIQLNDAVKSSISEIPGVITINIPYLVYMVARWRHQCELAQRDIQQNT